MFIFDEVGHMCNSHYKYHCLWCSASQLVGITASAN